MTDEQPMEPKHLWEAEHPYYCSSADNLEFADSWEDFMEEWGDADMDMNLLIRWDWKDDYERDTDDGYQSCHALILTWVQQRRGILATTVVYLQPEDEPKVREWLQTRFAHLMKVWDGTE